LGLNELSKKAFEQRRALLFRFHQTEAEKRALGSGPGNTNSLSPQKTLRDMSVHKTEETPILEILDLKNSGHPNSVSVY
jgi:hypothetical protein